MRQRLDADHEEPEGDEDREHHQLPPPRQLGTTHRQPADDGERDDVDDDRGPKRHLVIDHVIDGERVASRYAHMQYGSLKVKAGDTITVGTVIGNTGNTGRSFGAHTHFEILAGGTTAIDPIPWLREHAGG